MYDIVFISYNELNAEKNWQNLTARFSWAKRVSGVTGIHRAHIAAASKCFTNMFWVVDGDAEILETFDFSYTTKETKFVHVWRSLNPINDLEYGFGGVKLLPRLATLNMDTSKPDMTTSISPHFKPMPEVSNVTAFNTDPFSTWRSAFRECSKLSSKVIDRQKNDETENRLLTWKIKGADRPFGEYSLKGAADGEQFGVLNKGNIEELKKINDFAWLREQFERSYNGRS
jgi:hypothetical protein